MTMASGPTKLTGSNVSLSWSDSKWTNTIADKKYGNNISNRLRKTIGENQKREPRKTYLKRVSA